MEQAVSPMPRTPELEAEEIFHGMKHDATVDVLISLLAKGPATASNGW